jgi:transposase, IS5 family
MQTPAEKTTRLNLSTEDEVFALIISDNHPFKRINEIIDFATLTEPMRATYSTIGAQGIDVEKGIKALLIQFWEDYSDRNMEKALRENLAVKWFCGFGLTDPTPDYSYFSKLRKRIGTKRIATMFKEINATLETHGLFGNVFTFIDASTIITKAALWEERDRALADGEKKLNNSNVQKYATDKDAKWGAKSKNNIWFGHKRHCAVDMRYGLITKTAITNASVPDFKVVKSILPDQGAVFMDKLYDTNLTNQLVTAQNCHVATIQKDNRKDRNKDLNSWRSKTRMPFENVFSKLNKRARYRGHAKVTLQAFLQAMVHNLKKAIAHVPPSAIVCAT